MKLVENDIMNIRDVTDFGGLLRYFRDHLNWNLGIDDLSDVEDYAYGFDANDLGLKDEEFAKIKSLYQLPPLEANQQWGIFCVEFNTEKFSVTALRKILSRLVPTRRNATMHSVWDEKDLLFLCFWGTGGNRTICAAHFEQQSDALSQVRTIHCAPTMEDPVVLAHFEERLARLEWPKDTSDYEKWHNSWSAAFDTYWGEVIKTSAALAERMAKVAKDIKGRILEAMRVETAKGFIHLLCKKVKDMLVHDLDESDFADMYAQTIVYGLFSARCLDKTPDTFSIEEAIDLIPNTNPFLKNMMRDCCTVRKGGGISFDELGVADVVDMFAKVDAAKIAADFGRQTGGGREDPVIYFYEEFLKAYDKEQKVKCGEFYTPMPVVGFMVRAVDYILRTHFNMPDGLATDASKTIRVERTEKKGGREIKKEQVSAIQILDPALGTGTFLREIILSIYETFRSNHPELKDESLSKAWSRYVDCNVLPRLNGFELMMAPYAIAHMKLAMVLKETGYDFEGDERLRVYLTNSLEEPGDSDQQGTLFDDDPLSVESIAANAVKKNNGINIVIGNPPYNNSSTNKGEWILSLIQEYKEGLNERKINLDDDYIKFIRLAQSIIEQSGDGIVAYISNNSFIDGLTHRQMRKNLLGMFDEIYIFNLHGNARKQEKCPDGSPDENVFDIMQGVSINIFVKRGDDVSRRDIATQSGRTGAPRIPHCTVRYADLWGLREGKYMALDKSGLDGIKWQMLSPEEPNYFFVQKNLSCESEYRKSFSVVDLFVTFGSGAKMERDEICVHIDCNSLKKTVNDFSVLDVESIRKKYGLGKDSRDWSIERAKKDVIDHGTFAKYCFPINFRVFDERWIYYTGKSKGFVGTPGFATMKHMLRDNVCLAVPRQTSQDWRHVFVSNKLMNYNFIAVGGQNGASTDFPLYLYQEYHGKMQKVPNLNPEIVKKIEAALGEEPTSEDIFNYIYAVLHSPSYREKYKEFLKIDFPRIPYPTDAESFHALAALGAQLVAIHLMKDFDEAGDVSFEDGGDRVVGKVEWRDGDVFVNKKSFFTGVERETFDQYIGGYKPLYQWLKDRKGRALTDDDISHWKRIVRALRRTADLMAEIDKVFAPGIQRESADVGSYPTSEEADCPVLMAAESAAPYESNF